MPLLSSLCRLSVCTCLLQHLHVKLTEVEKVLLGLNQPEGIGNSARLDSLYWNVMRWLNYTYVACYFGFLACLGH